MGCKKFLSFAGKRDERAQKFNSLPEKWMRLLENFIPFLKPRVN
jgi:hypothetical protein